MTPELGAEPSAELDDPPWCGAARWPDPFAPHDLDSPDNPFDARTHPVWAPR